MGKVFINPNFHVILVHFPLGIFLIGVLVELLSFMYRRSTLRLAGRWMILLGALATIPVAFSGIYALNDIASRSQIGGRLSENATWKQVALGACLRGGGGADGTIHLAGNGLPPFEGHSAEETQAAWQMLSRHIWVEGAASGLIALIAVVFLGASDKMRRRLYYPFMVLLLGGAGLMGYGAWFAGESIYSLGAATRLQKPVPATTVLPAAMATPAAASPAPPAPAAPVSSSLSGPAADGSALAADPLPEVPPFRLVAAIVVSPTSEPATGPTSDPSVPPATEPATAPATTQSAPSATAPTSAPEPTTAPTPTPVPAATQPKTTAAPTPMPATTETTIPVTVPTPETAATTLPTTMPAAVAPPAVPPAGIIPPALPATTPAAIVSPVPPVTSVVSAPAPREMEESKLEDPNSPAYYVGPPLQIHVLLAGVAVAIALAALGTSWRRLSLLTPVLVPATEADTAALAAEEADAIAANNALGNRPVTGEDIDLVRSFRPGLTVGPSHVEIVPSGKLWLLAFLGIVLVAAVGVYVLAAPASLGCENTGWNTTVLWGAIVDKAQNPEGPITRRLAHVIGGAVLLLLPLLLAIFARWSRSKLLLGITSFLLVVFLAAQVWIGILLLYDTRVGNVTHFNTAPIVTPPVHVQSAST